MKLTTLLFLTISIWGTQIIPAVGQESNCQYSYFGQNDHLDAFVIRTKKEPFIEFFPTFKNQERLFNVPTIDIDLEKVGKRVFLHLHIDSPSPNTIENLGYIKTKSQLVIHYLSGENLVLLSIRDSYGKTINPASTIYSPIYYIPSERLKDVRKNDIDYISVQWSNVAETYETFQVDIMKKLIRCLEI